MLAVRSVQLSALLLTVGLLVPASSPAARQAHGRQLRAIQRAAFRLCSHDPTCHKGSAQISTVDSRYALGGAYSDGYSGALLLKRKGHWTVVGHGGGGVSTCSYWQHLAPRSVLRDLRIDGLRDGSPSGVPCW